MASPEAAEAVKKILENLTKPKGRPGTEPVAGSGEKAKKLISKKTPSTEEIRKMQAKETDKTQKEAQHADKDSVKETTRTYSIQKDIADHETESAQMMSARDRLQLLDEKFKPESTALQGGIHALRSIDWENPSTERWMQIQDVIKKLPTLGQVGANDRAVLREIHQTVLTHYHINRDAINPAEDVNFQKGVRESLPYASDKRLNEESVLTSAAVAERGPHARSSYRADSREWVDEIASQTLNGKRVPEVQLDNSVNPELVNREIAEKSGEAGWLVQNGEHIQNAQVAQVVHDVLNAGDLAGDKEYLLVKASQLKHIDRTDMPETERVELDKYRDRIKVKMLEACKKDNVPKDELNDWTHEASGFESGMPRRADSVGGWDSTKEPVSNPNLKKILDGFNAKKRLLSGGLLDQEVFKTFNKIVENFPPEDTKGIDHFLSGLADRMKVFIKTEGRGERGWSSLVVSPDIQHRYYLNWKREIRRTQDRLNNETRLFDNKLKEAVEYDRRNHIAFLQSDDFRKGCVEYFEDSENHPTILEQTGHQWYEHPTYRAMKTAEGDWEDPVTHKIIRKSEREYYELRQILVDKLTYGEMLQNAYVNYQLGGELDKMGGALAAFGEPGIISVLNDRGGVNADTFDVIERLGEDVMWGPKGEPINVSGPVLEGLVRDVESEMIKNLGLYEGKLKREFGDTLTREEMEYHIRASVRETFMLTSITGRRVQMIRRGLIHHEARGIGVNPGLFAGETAESKVLQAQEPIRAQFMRWGSLSPVQRAVIEKLARFECRRMGIDQTIIEEINALASMEPKAAEAARLRLWKHAFWIDEKTSPAEVDEVIKQYVQYDSRGNKLHFKHNEELHKTLSNKELVKWLTMREGVPLADQVMLAGYDYFGAHWNISESLTVINSFFTKDEIREGKNLTLAVHERLRSDLAFDPDGLFAADSEHVNLERSIDRLIKDKTDDKGKEGALHVMSRVSPIHIARALYIHEDPQVAAELQNIYGKYNLFQDAMPTDEHSGPRTDKFLKKMGMYHQLINKQMADYYIQLPESDPRRFRGLDSVDWQSGPDPTQKAVIRKFCTTIGMKTSEINDLIAASKELATYAGSASTLHRAAEPSCSKYFLTVNKVEARLSRYDDGDKSLDNDKKRYIGQWSSRISQFEGHGGGTGLKRWAGDLQNSWNAGAQHLLALLGANDIKTFEQHLPMFIDMVVNTGGWGSKARVAQTLTLAWARTHQRDFWKDFLGGGGETSLVASCEAQRISGLGQQSLTLQEYDHLMHFAEAAAGVKFHDKFHHFTDVAEREARVKVGVGKLSIHTVWLYRLGALGLLGGVLVGMGLIDNAKKGFSGQSSGGGGGSHEEH